jgi:hypothetical protein
MLKDFIRTESQTEHAKGSNYIQTGFHKQCNAIGGTHYIQRERGCTCTIMLQVAHQLLLGVGMTGVDSS